MSRASTPARPRRCGRAAWRSCRRATSSRQFEAAWTPAQLEIAPRRVGGALPHQGPGVRSGRRGGARRPAARPSTSSSSRWWRWFDEEGLDQRLGAGGGRRAARRRPALPAHARPARGHRRPTSCCCSTCGASWHEPGARVCRHHLGGLHRPRGARRAWRRRSTRSPRARDAAVTLVQDRGPRRAELRGWEVDRAARPGAGGRRVRGAVRAAPHRPQPGRERPWQRRASRRFRDPRRPPAAAGHRVHRRAGACTSTISASGPKSTCFAAIARRVVTGPRQDAIVHAGMMNGRSGGRCDACAGVEALMSNRKITLLLSRCPIVLTSVLVGMVHRVAARPVAGVDARRRWRRRR